MSRLSSSVVRLFLTPLLLGSAQLLCVQTPSEVSSPPLQASSTLVLVPALVRQKFGNLLHSLRQRLHPY